MRQHYFFANQRKTKKACDFCEKMSNFAAENPAFSGAFFARVVSLGLGATHLRKSKMQESAGYQHIADRREQKFQDLASKKGGICEKRIEDI